MPTIAIFFGMIVRMWHDDHPPPHIHVEYQGFEALVAIETGFGLAGGIAPKSGRHCARLVLVAPNRTAQ